ncbi:MAG TPA: glutamate-5-semialdehyde dehydrogenase [Nitrospirales bacterium]|nr:glutamate-5-semialdehyde dehydrogenase [Nitrospiraceae bacterium]HNP30858.1 glutamate-5-semialdehyde dehydrogenase [Nitrospirales bacterium]
MVEVPLKLYVQALLKGAKDAARSMSCISPRAKNQALQAMAESLVDHTEEILEANAKDLAGISKETDQQVHREASERIRISEDTIQLMHQRLLDLQALPDPIGEASQGWMTVDGLQVHTVRSPLGVVAIVSDMGPLVLGESFGMCVKTNNVCVFRGGTEWLHTNSAVVRCLQAAAASQGVPEGGLTFLDRSAPEAALEVVRYPQYVQAVITRGRTGLRNRIVEQSKVQVIGFDGGLCHVYVDQDVDIPLAQTIVVNAKMQSPSAANAMDTLLVHQGVSRHLLPGLTRRLLQEYRVNLHGCPKTVSMMGVLEMSGHLGIKAAEETDWGEKYQSLTMNIKVVKDSQEAIDHIGTYAPGHTDTIVTRDYQLAMRFVREVDSSAVMVNASTRLHGGPQFGLGPDMGSNSTRVHGRGPLILSKLTIEKYMVLGTGQLQQPHPVPQTYQDAMMLSAKF